MGCKYKINIDYHNPEFFSFNLDKNDTLCINSSLSLLSMLFTSLPNCSIRAFKNNRNSLFKEQYNAIINYKKISGIDFGWDIGHIEILARENGRFAFSLFSFPKKCGLNRYVIHSPSARIGFNHIIPRKLYVENNQTLCVFVSGSTDYLFSIPPNIRFDNIKTHLCNTDSCIPVQDHGWRFVPSQNYLLFNSTNSFSPFYYSFSVEQLSFYPEYESKSLLSSKSITLIMKQQQITNFSSKSTEKTNRKIIMIYGLSFFLFLSVIVAVFINQHEDTVTNDEEKLLQTTSI